MIEIDILIQKYIHGETSEEENLQLHKWIHESPENEKRLFAEKDIWDSYGYYSNKKNYETAVELEILRNHVLTESKPSLSLKYILKVAAILLIAFGLGWGSQFISFTDRQQIAQVTMQEIFVPKGQVNQIFLADGTRIWLNSETKFTAPSVFAANERVVKLNGEAFFEVSKDNKRPFRVEVNGQKIVVLGTSFNIRAYENSNKIETTLETGQIRLQTGNNTTILKPGEQSLYNKTDKKLQISKVYPETFSSWKDGRYEFQNEDLLEVFKIIERWYDVEITADESYFKGMHFSGVIKRNKDAKHFLELLNITVPIKYHIYSDKIQIENQKKQKSN